MAAISLRLSDDIEARLAEEARIEERPRSEVVRAAIVEFLDRRERERFMAEMVAEMRAGYADAARREEALDIAESAVDDGLDAIIEAERAAGIDPAEKWWR